MADITALLGVIAYTGALALLTELTQYFFIYRTTRFRTLKTNFEKHAQKLEAAKGTTTSRGVKKREAKLQGWEGEAGKEVGLLQFKTGFVMIASVLISVRIVPALFGNVSVAQLPFQPPAFLLKACLRAIISKILDWGPSRRMQQAKPYVPKFLKQS